MAEVLGLIASSVQMAALAKQITGVAMKMRALYHEIQDAPEELAVRLQELHLLAGILSRSNLVSPDVASLCESCLSELKMVLLVLKKRLIQKLDDRLCRSVQLLQLATSSHMASSYSQIIQKQDYMMSFLKTRFSHAKEPDDTVSEATLETGFAEPRWTEERKEKPFSQKRTSINPEDTKMWCLARSIDSTPRVARVFGLPSLTGAIQFERNKLRSGDHECSKKNCEDAKCPNASLSPTIWARFALPRWLSYRVLEVVAQQARIGWKQYIRVRNVFPRLGVKSRTPFQKACESIAYGQLQSLREMVDKREVTPWDEDGRGETIWATALYFSRWDICNYLMDLGAEPSASLPIHRERRNWFVEDIAGFWSVPAALTSAARQSTQAERRKFVDRVFDNDGLRFSLLSGFDGDLDEFISLRRSIWPDESFYHPEFSKQRMQFAISIACAQNVGKMAPWMIRSILGLDIVEPAPVLEFQFCNSLGRTIFHGLAGKVAVTTGTQSSADWHRLTRDILARVTDTKHLNQDGNTTFRFVLKDIPQGTALMCLITYGVIMEAHVSHIQGHNLPRPPSAIIAGCEASIMAWLNDLHESGIDLIEYGMNELNSKARQPQEDKDDLVMLPGVFSHEARVCGLYDTLCLVRSLRLISFQYGHMPMDWKFWWNEPSDEFSGDFWHLVEHDSTTAHMSVPGAWVD